MTELASKKCIFALSQIAKKSISLDHGWDEVHEIVSDIELGLPRSKKVIMVEYNGEESHMVFLFIARNEKEVTEKIAALPDRLNPEERNKFVEKIIKLVDCKEAFFDCPDTNMCVFVSKNGDWHGKTVDGIRLRQRIP